MALCVLDPEISTQEQLSAAFCIFHIVTYFFFLSGSRGRHVKENLLLLQIQLIYGSLGLQA